MRQLDDGIGNTLVLTIKGLRRALAVPHNVDSNLGTADADAVTDRHGPQVDGLSRYGNGLGHTSFHGANTKVSPIPWSN